MTRHHVTIPARDLRKGDKLLIWNAKRATPRVARVRGVSTGLSGHLIFTNLGALSIPLGSVVEVEGRSTPWQLP